MERKMKNNSRKNKKPIKMPRKTMKSRKLSGSGHVELVSASSPTQ